MGGPSAPACARAPQYSLRKGEDRLRLRAWLCVDSSPRWCAVHTCVSVRSRAGRGEGEGGGDERGDEANMQIHMRDVGHRQAAGACASRSDPRPAGGPNWSDTRTTPRIRSDQSAPAPPASPTRRCGRRRAIGPSLRFIVVFRTRTRVKPAGSAGRVEQREGQVRPSDSP